MKRSVRPIALEDLTPASLSPQRPALTWVDPCSLLVNEQYQREVGRRGLKLINKIIAEFEWSKFKPPTVVETDEGLEIVDGQHSAIACASHPDIKEIPIFLVESKDLSDRARAFIGINQDRLAVNAMQIHIAAASSGNERAGIINEICAQTGINILRSARGTKQYGPRDTVAVRAIANLLERRGRDKATQILKVLAQAQLAPISAAHIKAADLLLSDEEYKEKINEDLLLTTIVKTASHIDREAKVFASEHSVPFWRGLASSWFRSASKAQNVIPAPRRSADGLRANQQA